jgi:hypothetical protein
MPSAQYQAENPTIASDQCRLGHSPSTPANPVTGIAVSASPAMRSSGRIGQFGAPGDYIYRFRRQRPPHPETERFTDVPPPSFCMPMPPILPGTWLAWFCSAVRVSARSPAPGVGWLMITGLRNFRKSDECFCLYESGHLSVGASTAVFGAVGILCALQAVNAARSGKGWKRMVLVFGAGVALLAFLGTSARSDLGAHLFGFFSGAVMGGAYRLVEGAAGR